jgi:transcriptional regulator with XRE-family HTH domain
MFWDIFVRLCQQNHVSPNAVAKECGVKSSGTVSAWKRGAMPRDGVLASIADYFDVTVEFLTGISIEAGIMDAEARLAAAMEAYKKETDEQKRYDLACEIDTLRESILDQQLAHKMKTAPTENGEREGRPILVSYNKRGGSRMTPCAEIHRVA